VFVVRRNQLSVSKSTLEKREIHVGIADATNYEVVSGLQEGSWWHCPGTLIYGMDDGHRHYHRSLQFPGTMEWLTDEVAARSPLRRERRDGGGKCKARSGSRRGTACLRCQRLCEGHPGVAGGRGHRAAKRRSAIAAGEKLFRAAAARPGDQERGERGDHRPRNSIYHEWLGKAYGEKADHAGWFSAISFAKKTRKEFETAVQLDGNNFSARQALIEFDCSAPGLVGGGEEKALPQIKQLAAMDAAEGHYAAGNCRRQKKDYAVADEEFAKALESNPKSAELIYDIGDYEVKRGQPERLLASRPGRACGTRRPKGEFTGALRWF